METIAIIDTETTWSDQIMSLGIILADSETYIPFKGRCYLVDPEYKKPAMYTASLWIRNKKPYLIDSRIEVMKDIQDFLYLNHVQKIFAYNANFDKGHLPELHGFEWYDIMRLAAYKQFNPCICGECWKTGRLKRNYGVQAIYRLLSKNDRYEETHNAFYDALDECKIMELLKLDLEIYENGKI